MNKPTVTKAKRFWTIIASHPERDWENLYLEVRASSREEATEIAKAVLEVEKRVGWIADLVIDSEPESPPESTHERVERTAARR